MREGISVIQCGPSLETRAELRMMRALGGDVVGLSCVSFTVIITFVFTAICDKLRLLG